MTEKATVRFSNSTVSLPAAVEQLTHNPEFKGSNPADTGTGDSQIQYNHRDKSRVQIPAKMFPHLKLLCWLFMGPALDFDTSKETVS